MNNIIKLGIIICDRYRRCTGGKCFKSLQNREGAFSLYKGKPLELVGYTTCDGCPGGNIEYAIEEMLHNGASRIHLATGLIVGYPPCPHIEYFQEFIHNKYDIPVICGTHPIPDKYFMMHKKLGSWDDPRWKDLIEVTLTNKQMRISYN